MGESSCKYYILRLHSIYRRSILFLHWKYLVFRFMRTVWQRRRTPRGSLKNRRGESLYVMKKAAFSGMILALVLCLSMTAAACAEGFPAGEWAFAEKPDVPVLRVNEDGTALYGGLDCTWEDDGRFLLLTNAEGQTLSLRYLVTEKRPFLYVTFGYTRKEGTEGEGIIGVWDQDGSEKSFFEFTANHRFLEDGVFDGTYEVDYENGSFTLIYPMYFDDTVCYFRQDGNRMILEYPWPLAETAAP